MSVEAYPLQWPDGIPRTNDRDRRAAPFAKKTGGRIAYTRNLTVADAVERLHEQIGPRKLPAKHVVISSNMKVRNDGLPYSKQSEPDDPGVAVYFQLYGDPHCLPCDTFTRVADNIAAIAGHIEATRKIERYGVATTSQMYEGFRRLDAPQETPWWEVLGIERDAPWEEIELRYRRRRGEAHPDREGGDAAEFDRVERAMDQARQERGDQ